MQMSPTRWAGEPIVISGAFFPLQVPFFFHLSYLFMCGHFIGGYNMFLTPLIVSWGPPCRHSGEIPPQGNGV